MGSAMSLRPSMEIKIGNCGSDMTAQLYFSSNLTLVEVNQVTSSKEHEADYFYSVFSDESII